MHRRVDAVYTTEVELLQLAPSGGMLVKGDLTVVVWAPDVGITSSLWCIFGVDRLNGFCVYLYVVL